MRITLTVATVIAALMLLVPAGARAASEPAARPPDSPWTCNGLPSSCGKVSTRRWDQWDACCVRYRSMNCRRWTRTATSSCAANGRASLPATRTAVESRPSAPLNSLCYANIRNRGDPFCALSEGVYGTWFAAPLDRGNAAAAPADLDVGLRNYMLRIYNYMASGLALTGIVAYVFAASGIYQEIARTPLVYVVMLAPLGLVMWLSFGINRMSAGAAQRLLALRRVMGISMAGIFLVLPGPASPACSSSPPAPSPR